MTSNPSNLPRNKLSSKAGHFSVSVESVHHSNET